jgi:diguanylate cyclase (GGDEF)-like protein
MQHSPIRIVEAGKPTANLHPEVTQIFKSSLRFVQFCQDQMSQEESFKGVMRKFVHILSSIFAISKVSYIALAEDSKHVVERSPATFPPVKGIPLDRLESLKLILKTQLLRDRESEVSGLSVINLNDSSYSALMLVDPSGATGCLLWESSLARGNGLTFLDDAAEQVEISNCIDFLSKHLQQTARWLRRLDRSQELLYQDEVTNAYNYRYLNVALETEIRRMHRFHTPFSILFIDLDNFKGVNDLYGHQSGSLVLKQAASVIRQAVRDVDIIIRYGGDEFVVVLVGAHSKQASFAGERVRRKIQDHRFLTEGEEVVRITASIGVASCPEHANDAQSIIKLADDSMYRSKKTGKNRVLVVSSIKNPDHLDPNSSEVNRPK